MKLIFIVVNQREDMNAPSVELFSHIQDPFKSISLGSIIQGQLYLVQKIVAKCLQAKVQSKNICYHTDLNTNGLLYAYFVENIFKLEQIYLNTF